MNVSISVDRLADITRAALGAALYYKNNDSLISVGQAELAISLIPQEHPMRKILEEEYNEVYIMLRDEDGKEDKHKIKGNRNSMKQILNNIKYTVNNKPASVEEA